MPDSRTLWTAVVIICIAISVFFSVKKRTTFKRLQQLMAAKQWDELSLIHISEPTRLANQSRMPSSA